MEVGLADLADGDGLGGLAVGDHGDIAVLLHPLLNSSQERTIDGVIGGVSVSEGVGQGHRITASNAQSEDELFEVWSLVLGESVCWRGLVLSVEDAVEGEGCGVDVEGEGVGLVGSSEVCGDDLCEDVVHAVLIERIKGSCEASVVEMVGLCVVSDEEFEIDRLEKPLDSIECASSRKDVEDEDGDAVGIRHVGEIVLGKPPPENIDDPQLIESVDDQGEMANEETTGGRSGGHPHPSPICTATVNRQKMLRTSHRPRKRVP